MRALLRLTEWLCGKTVAQSIFEPLIADWERELANARHAGWWRYASSATLGGAAFARSLAQCVLMGAGWLPTARSARTASLTFVLAVAIPLLVWTLPAVLSGRAPGIDSIQTQAFLLYFAVLIVPPAMLPALFMMRRDARSATQHAVATIAFGAVLTGAVAAVATPAAINRYFTSFDAFEREYQRGLANDRAGRFQYPGTAIREQRRSTIEQRRESYQRFEAMRAEREARRPPLTWPQRLRRSQPVAYAILFGVMGWTLAGLAAPTLARAAGWWALMVVAMLTLAASPALYLGVAVHRLPSWTTLPLFTLVAMALVTASWRRRKAPAPTP